MRKTLAAIGATLMCLVTPATSQALVNGSEVQDGDSNAAAVVQISACTGAVVAPQWVLTARHCVEVQNLRRSVYTGIDRAQRKDPSLKYISDYALLAPTGDVALAHVTTPLNVANIPAIRRRKADFGTEGTVYGWGNGTGLKLASAQVDIGKYAWGLGGPREQEGSFFGYHRSGTRNGRGDSGGPLFVDGEIAGVTSASYLRGNGAVSFASLHGLYEWIENTIGEDSVWNPPLYPQPREDGAQEPRQEAGGDNRLQEPQVSRPAYSGGLGSLSS
ncbi:putative secreted protease [Corynebacterium kutscheri]|uniref:Secreted protease n=1 Tax=Corynebacterium kutscheri TaxID=35755 RepID=A0A0F6R1L2_9CORY|nr:S1 family peptidase [Corynebacterium kutscheri]AKE41930.1 Trypsin [Corynebacterium kutscheri]VEH06436.1 putative secreted protease [Corynebacterium kutscheri]VEH10265.1 putative secreted protease [Corynebacterium kutscheri]VEH82353.1 putative secreted protease [Corynebacterium kutscheri]